jgi:hypothetical protein
MSMCQEKSGIGALLVKHGFNMRLLLALLILGSSVLGARAASPSFSSFSQTNFVTNGLFISLRLTNTFGTLYVTNIYITTNRTEILVAGNTYITNLYVTNLYSTNIVINGTNAASQGDLVWTNVAGVIQPRPLQITNALTFVSGSADNATNSAVVVDVVNQWTDVNAGLLSFRDRGTNVAYVTPFGGYMSGRSTGQINPADTDVFIGVRDAAKGETATAGFWVGAYDDASSPTNFGYAYITANGGPGADFVTFNMAAEDTNDASYFRVQVGSSSGSGSIELVQRSATNFAVVDNSGFSGTGTNFLRDDGTYGPAVGGSDGTNTTVLQLGPFTPTRIPVANGTNTLTDGPFYIASAGSTNVILDGGLIVGGTNSLAYLGGFFEGLAFGYFNDTDNGGSGAFNAILGGGSGSGDQAYLDLGGNKISSQLSASIVLGSDLYNNVVNANTNLTTMGSYIGWNSTNLLALRPFIQDTAGAYAYTFDTKALASSGIARFMNGQTNLIAIGPTGNVILGPGTTNSIFRNANDLVYTNGGNSVNFEVRKGDGASVKLGLTTGSHGIVLAGTGSDLYFGVNNGGSGNYVMQASSFSSTDAGLDDLGSGVLPWDDVYTDQIILTGITKVQKTALTPANGMIVYQTDNTPGLRVYVNGTWVMVSTVADP